MDITDTYKQMNTLEITNAYEQINTLKDITDAYKQINTPITDITNESPLHINK